jgi:integrase
VSTVIIQRRDRKKGTTYPVYYKDPLTGNKKYWKTYDRFRLAQQARNELKALLDMGKQPEKKETKIRLLTFAQVADSLESEWNLRLRQGSLRKKTHEDYNCWLNVLVRNFGEKPLCQIGKADIENYINGLLIEFTVITANKYISMFSKVFAHGIKLRAALNNPADEIPRFNEKDHDRKEFLLPNQLNQLIEATQSNRAKHYMPAIIYLGAEHAAAKQEILDLNWKDIDFDYGDTGIINFFRTKNKKRRVESLMPRSRQAILSWRDHLERRRRELGISEPQSDRVFCRLDGTPIKSFDRAWKASLKKAGITNFHFHDLRHTFASNMLLSGASLKDVKEMMGHSDISMTDRYAHLTHSHMLQKQSKLAEHYQNENI